MKKQLLDCERINIFCQTSSLISMTMMLFVINAIAWMPCKQSAIAWTNGDEDLLWCSCWPIRYNNKALLETGMEKYIRSQVVWVDSIRWKQLHISNNWNQLACYQQQQIKIRGCNARICSSLENDGSINLISSTHSFIACQFEVIGLKYILSKNNPIIYVR